MSTINSANKTLPLTAGVAPRSGNLELFYLVELTRKRIKFLSRWEKPLSEEVLRWIRRYGLVVDIIPRRTLLRRRIYETVFSTSSRYVDYYHRKFYNTLLYRNPDSQRCEGRMFGYPSCCVEQFIRRHYLPNGLRREDQEILFHWACPGCRATPDLLPYYRTVHQQVQEWYQREIGPLQPTDLKPAQRLERKLALAATTVLLLSTVSLTGQATGTSHFLPIPEDIDSDGLSYAEEFYLGTDFSQQSTYPGGLIDGEYWAQFFKAVIDTLPTEPQSDRPYKIENLFRGLEYCSKCSTLVNMGYVTLVNPIRNLQLDIPFVGLHYLEHGCFSYQGDLHTGRIAIDTLKRILYPYDIEHLLAVAGDTDGDGLTDVEEDSLNLDPTVADTDADGVPDGAQVAEQLIRLLPKLKEDIDNIHSTLSFHKTWGLESCQVCGAVHNMGYVEFLNPENGRTCQIHFNGLHALAHGSFAYDGTANPDQRVNAVDLYRAVKNHVLFIGDDTDDDGLTDIEEAYFGYDADEIDTDGNSESDGTELALSLADKLERLPTNPIADGPYVNHGHMFGVYNCPVCGEAVNMGSMEVFNPSQGADSLSIPYYVYHFLQKGSFAYEGRVDTAEIEAWDEARIDPIKLAAYLDYQVGVRPDPMGLAPDGYILHQNFPNPFNPVSTIRYELPQADNVSLIVYDILGREVARLVEGYLEPGYHQIQWDGRDRDGGEVPTGVYIARLVTTEYSKSIKMVLLK
ncbi:MAG: T9SS type A sorting domain-containing protein [Fidelibacterota bacterium]|nr:MAG: T9SS type A sorting domain-containing protein [Candidatus Neomarinimicrobiota bacterium]